MTWTSHTRIIAGRYRLDHPIGRGGMGEVWAGYDTRLDRRVAIKLLPQPLPDGLVGTEARDEAENRRLRFLREVRATAGLTITGIPAVYDTGVDADDQLYLVMQLLDGTELQILIDETDWETDVLPVCWVAAVGAQIAAVLVEVHRRSIVHRDIKPRNLYLTPGGIVKVLDFGVAALSSGDDTARLTRIGQTVGTPPYMAPEQILGSAVGPATDIYGLGCVLHELLVGRPPFTAGNGVSVQEHHMRTAPVPIRSVRPDVPAAIETLILAMLAKTAEDRPDAEATYDLLMPFASRLAAVPGFDHVNPCLPFVRPMAASAPTRPARPPRPSPADEPPLPDEYADAVRERAVALVGDGQFTQAIDLLDTALARGGSEEVVVDLRRVLAGTLLIAGAYRRALAEFEAAGRSYTRLFGADDEDALECRYQAALCRAQLGEHSAAVDALREFLVIWRRVKGPDDQRVLGIRRQIAVLLTGMRRFDEARAALVSLRTDLERLAGPGSEEVAAIDDQLARLERYATPR